MKKKELKSIPIAKANMEAIHDIAVAGKGKRGVITVQNVKNGAEEGRLNRLYVGTIQKYRNAMVLLQGQELRLVSSIRNGLSEKCCHVQQESARYINWHLHAI